MLHHVLVAPKMIQPLRLLSLCHLTAQPPFFLRTFTTTPPFLLRTFTTTPHVHKHAPPLPPRTPIPEKDLTIAYVKGSGPGGQKINKTSSAVQIKHLPSGIVIKCQDTRSRDQNEKLAMKRLQDRLEQGEKGVESRVEKRWELLRKRKERAKKKSRRKYRALEEEGKTLEDGRDGEVEEGGSGTVEAEGEGKQQSSEMPARDTQLPPSYSATREAAIRAFMLEKGWTEDALEDIERERPGTLGSRSWELYMSSFALTLFDVDEFKAYMEAVWRKEADRIAKDEENHGG